jgi:putative membrane protein
VIGMTTAFTTLAEAGWHGGGPLWLLLWLLILGAVVWLVARRLGERRPDALDRAREILAERYARGELSGDEYRERLEGLH